MQRIARSRIQFYFSQRIAATEKSIAQCNTPEAIFLSDILYISQERVRIILVFFISKLPRPTFSGVARQVAEKIA